MRVAFPRLAGGSIAALTAVVLLAACASEPAPEPTAPAPTSDPGSPAPTSEPTADPNADALFTITANVRAVDGRTIGISMTAHAPLASTDEAAEDIREQLVSVCAEGNGAQPITEEYLADNGSTLVEISIDSSSPGLTFATPIELLYGSPYYAQSASGEGVTPAPGDYACFNGYYNWAKSGQVSGVAEFENSDGVPDLRQWQIGRYGFSVSPSSGATIEACRVNITELGMSEDLAEIPGWDPSHAGDGISCRIGYVGE